MKLTTKTRYALRALIDLELNSKDTPIQLKDISRRQGISESYLENIFTSLRKHNILGAIKGKKGGFFIKKSPSEITILDVVNAVDEEYILVECVENPHTCPRFETCISRFAWITISNELKRTLSEISLQSLIEKNYLRSFSIEKDDNTLL